MNAGDPDSCREPWHSCVLELPTWSDWVASGRGGDDPETSLRLFSAANATVAAGLAHVNADGACLFGHTDHLHSVHANVAIRECRPHYQGDTCMNPAPAPFVCACVAEDVAFRAQDTMGEEERFYFVMLGLGCVCAAAFMLLLRILVATRDWLRRRFSHGGLRYAAPPSQEAGMPYGC